MSGTKRFPFYKHLLVQECRKDIVLQNDFINTRNRERSTPLFTKLKDKATKNKMRLAYLTGFSLLFALGSFYDAFFQSSFYSAISNRVERMLVKIDGGSDFKEVSYNNPKAVQLGKYFRSLEYANSRKQITAAALSLRVPAFSECTLDSLDVNSFVNFCLKHSINVQQLPSPSTL